MWRKRLLRVLLATAAAALFVGGGMLVWFTRPYYAWLTFGPHERVRMLVCDRGLWIATTQFVDGKQTSPVARSRDLDALHGLTLHDPDGQTTYTITDPSDSNYGSRGKPPQLIAKVDIQGPLAYRQYCDVSLAARDAPSARVAHFHGPLTAGPVTLNWKLPAKLALKRGDMPTTLRAFVGTMDAARGCWVVVSSHDEHFKPRFPEGIRPEVEIVFAAESEGQPPVVERYALDQVCCGCLFYAPVRVPDAAGDGLARVTFSFPSWNAAQVATSTIELPVVSAPTETPPDVVTVRIPQN